MPPTGYEYVISKSSQSVQWSGNFTGQIPFVFKTPTNKWCKPRECYMAVKLRTIYRDGNGNQTSLKTHRRWKRQFCLLSLSFRKSSIYFVQCCKMPC